MTRAEARLKASLQHVLLRAEYDARKAMAGIDVEEVMAPSGWIDLSSIPKTTDAIEGAFREKLPAIFDLYNEEASRYLNRSSGLRAVTRQAVMTKLHDLEDSLVFAFDDFSGMGLEALRENMSDVRTRILGDLEAHFRHPVGMMPWHQRHSFKVAIAVAAVTVVLSIVGSWVFGLLG